MRLFYQAILIMNTSLLRSQIIHAFSSQTIIQLPRCLRHIHSPHHSFFCNDYKNVVKDHKKKRLQFFSGTDDMDEEYVDDWKAGDFEADANILRMEIAKSRAQDDINEKERLHLMDEFAKLRRPIIPDLKKFLMYPTLGVWTVVGLLLSVSSRKNGILSFLLKSSFQLMDVLYWALYIYSPLFLFGLRKNNNYRKKNKEQQPSQKNERQMNSLDWDLVSFDDDGMKKDPRKDCSDHVTCLLENWSCAVFSTALTLPLLYLLNHRFPQKRTRLTFLLMALSQLINRLGSVASQYQYPKLLYQLQRDNQPRPILPFAFFLQRLVSVTNRLLPIGFAFDTAKIIHHRSHIFSSYCYHTKVASVSASSAAIATAKTTVKISFIKVLRKVFQLSLAFNFIIPTIYIIALAKIIQIQYFTDISLTQSYEQVKNNLLNHNTNTSTTTGFQWRYKLKWREPRRLVQSIKYIWRDLIISFFTGWGEDNSMFERNRKKNEISRLLNNNQQIFSSSNNNGEEDYYDGLRILQLVAEDQEMYPDDARNDRSTWASDATINMAKFHQECYDKKDFLDPLGIALQQTLGIGLSLDFDHDSLLSKGSTPSIHRLRARLAKSAIKRTNDIIPKKGEKILNDIKDPVARFRAAMKLSDDAEKEIQYMADTLLDLIPTNAPLPEGKTFNLDTVRTSDVRAITNLQQQNNPNFNNDMTTSQEPPPDPWKKVIMRDFGEEFLDDPYLNADENFVKDYLKNKGLEISDYYDEDDNNSTKTNDEYDNDILSNNTIA